MSAPGTPALPSLPAKARPNSFAKCFRHDAGQYRARYQPGDLTQEGLPIVTEFIDEALCLLSTDAMMLRKVLNLIVLATSNSVAVSGVGFVLSSTMVRLLLNPNCDGRFRVPLSAIGRPTA